MGPLGGSSLGGGVFVFSMIIGRLVLILIIRGDIRPRIIHVAADLAAPDVNKIAGVWICAYAHLLFFDHDMQSAYEMSGTYFAPLLV